MKRMFVILVALIGFGIGAYAQCVTAKVTTESRDNGDTMVIKVEVQVQGSGKFEVRVDPKGDKALIFSTLNRTKETVNGKATFEFTCNSEQLPNATCKAYDFKYQVNGKAVEVCE